MEIKWTQDVITFLSGAFGVGVAYGAFRSKINAEIKTLVDRISKMERRQAVLRGEDKGALPIYMTRDSCTQFRGDCRIRGDEAIGELTKKICRDNRAIEGLQNFARWFLQDKGLTIKEINDILSPKD